MVNLQDFLLIDVENLNNLNCGCIVTTEFHPARDIVFVCTLQSVNYVNI